MRDQISHQYEFGSFHLNPKEGLLLHRGQSLPLTQKQFETLLVLVHNSGRLVTKEELMGQVWTDTCVEPSNLTQSIFVLRKVLAQSEPLVQFIETAPRHGYRFVAPVKRIPMGSDWADSKTSRVFDRPEEGAANREEFRSLAVLPFVNATASPDGDYFADGLTESIINQLSKQPALRVVARDSVFKYKGQNVESKKVGRDLNVRTVVTGRLVQLGERLIIKVDLVDVANGWQLWGEKYQRSLSDILIVEEEIAAEICEALRLKLTARDRQRTKHHTDSIDAYRLYLKGRFYWDKYSYEGLKKAIVCCQQAIEIDPTYALAYAGLADCYYRLSNTYLKPAQAMPKARAAALRALEIDETLPEAHAALGLVKMLHEWDWLGAEQHFLRAIELNQNCSIAHQRLGLFYNLLGRHEEAIAQLRVAMNLDPLSSQISQGLSFAFMLIGEYDRAVEEARGTLALESNYHPAHYLLGWVHERRGELSEAVASFERVVALDDSPLFLAALGYAYAVSGLSDKARDVLNQLQQQSSERFVSHYSRGVVYAGLGEKDRAFECLELAYEERSDMMVWLNIGPEWGSLRADPRFASLRERVGLHRDYRQKYSYSIAR